MHKVTKWLIYGGAALFFVLLVVFSVLTLPNFFPDLRSKYSEDLSATEELVFYTGTGDHYFRERAKIFEKEFQIPIRIVVNGSEVTMRKVRQESSHSTGSMDCIIINSSWQREQLEADGVIYGYYPLYRTACGFIYDSEILKHPPRSWPEFSQWITENPGKFGFAVAGGEGGFSFLYSASQVSGFYGNDSLWQWFRSARDDMLYTSSDYDSLRLLSSGKLMMISGVKHQMLYALDTAELSSSAKMYIPDFGALTETYGVAVPANTRHSYNASLFIQFLLKAESLDIMEKSLYVESVKSFSKGVYLPAPDAQSHKYIVDSFKNKVLYY